MFHDTVGGMVAGKRRRSDEGERDADPQPKRAHEGEEKLADAISQSRCYGADDKAAGPTGAALIRPHAGGDACKERQRKDCEREE